MRFAASYIKAAALVKTRNCFQPMFCRATDLRPTGYGTPRRQVAGGARIGHADGSPEWQGIALPWLHSQDRGSSLA